MANLRVAVTQRVQQDGQWRQGRERQAERGGDFNDGLARHWALSRASRDGARTAVAAPLA